MEQKYWYHNKCVNFQLLGLGQDKETGAVNISKIYTLYTAHCSSRRYNKHRTWHWEENEESSAVNDTYTHPSKMSHIYLSNPNVF